MRRGKYTVNGRILYIVNFNTLSASGKGGWGVGGAKPEHRIIYSSYNIQYYCTMYIYCTSIEKG